MLTTPNKFPKNDSLIFSKKSNEIILERPKFWEFLLLAQILDEELISVKKNLKHVIKNSHPDISFRNFKDLLPYLDECTSELDELLKFAGGLSDVSSKNEKVFGALDKPGDPPAIAFLAKKLANDYFEAARLGEVARNKKNKLEEYFRKNVSVDVTWLLITSIAIVKTYFFQYTCACDFLVFVDDIPRKMRSSVSSLVASTPSTEVYSLIPSGNVEIVPALFKLSIQLIQLNVIEGEFKNQISPFNGLVSIDQEVDLKRINSIQNEVTLPGIRSWIYTQSKFSMSDLRNKLLPLDLFPNAVINDINERALDLTGELALEEDLDMVAVRHEILSVVIDSLDESE